MNARIGDTQQERPSQSASPEPEPQTSDLTRSGGADVGKAIGPAASSRSGKEAPDRGQPNCNDGRRSSTAEMDALRAAIAAELEIAWPLTPSEVLERLEGRGLHVSLGVVTRQLRVLRDAGEVPVVCIADGRRDNGGADAGPAERAAGRQARTAARAAAAAERARNAVRIAKAIATGDHELAARFRALLPAAAAPAASVDPDEALAAALVLMLGDRLRRGRAFQLFARRLGRGDDVFLRVLAWDPAGRELAISARADRLEVGLVKLLRTLDENAREAAEVDRQRPAHAGGRRA